MQKKLIEAGAVCAAAFAGDAAGLAALLAAGGSPGDRFVEGALAPDGRSLRLGDGVTALYAAAANGHLGDGHLRCVEMLLAAGADVEEVAIHGWRPLMGACVAEVEGPESLEMALRTLRALIAAGADLDARDEKGCTAVMWAADEGEFGMVETLAEAGADLDLLDRDGRGALWFSERRGQDKMASFIKNMASSIRERRELEGAVAEKGGGPSQRSSI